MNWLFKQDEECYYVNWILKKVVKSQARHSLRGRITEEELYEMKGKARGDYYIPYSTRKEALNDLRSSLRHYIVKLQDRLQELEDEVV